MISQNIFANNFLSVLRKYFKSHKYLSLLVITYIITKLFFLLLSDQIVDIKRGGIGTLDDYTYIINALNIYKLHWLGAYRWDTLVVAPVYSIILAFFNCIKLNFVEVNIFLVIISIGFLFIDLQIKFKKRVFLVFLIIFILWVSCFNRYFFSSYREIPHVLFAFFFMALNCSNIQEPKKSIISALILSLLFFIREEMFYVLLPYLAFFVYRTAKLNCHIRMKLATILVFFAIPLIILFFNFAKYDIFQLDDRNYGPARELTARLYSINLENKLSSDVITLNERKFLYENSNEFHNLGAIFLDPLIWTDRGGNTICPTCPIKYSFIDFFIKDILKSNNYYVKNGNETIKKLRRMSAEIKRLCSSGQMDCSRRHFTFNNFSTNLPSFTESLSSMLNIDLGILYGIDTTNAGIQFSRDESKLGFEGKNGEKNFVNLFRFNLLSYVLISFLVFAFIVPIFLFYQKIINAKINSNLISVGLFCSTIFYGKIFIFFMMCPFWNALANFRFQSNLYSISSLSAIFILIFYFTHTKNK